MYARHHHMPIILIFYSLFLFVQASLEFALCCKKDDLRQKFEETFFLWCRAIITYCKETQVRSTALQIETAGWNEDLGVGK